MKDLLFSTLKDYKKEYLPKDIFSGIIMAAVSIPISMGYAQIAGLPAVYGLYCSILPVLIYGLVTSSPQFVFGVDATPAALVGGTLATLGIVSGSEEAKAVVPSITLVAALWLLLYQSRAYCQLHIDTCNGWIHKRYWCDNNSYADSEAVWR